MKYIMECRYYFNDNRIKFGIAHVVTEENSKNYHCQDIGMDFNKSHEDKIKISDGHLSMWRAVEVREEKYISNMLNTARWQIVDEIKDFLRSEIENMEVV